jgi:hypothetical protein
MFYEQTSDEFVGYESLGPAFNSRQNLNKDTCISPELNYSVCDA